MKTRLVFVENQIDGERLTPVRLRVAHRIHERLLGLFNKKALVDADALLLEPCNSVHTVGMPTDLDIAFLDAQGLVLKSLRNVPPRQLASCREAHSTVERFSKPNETWLKTGQRVVSISIGSPACHQ